MDTGLSRECCETCRFWNREISPAKPLPSEEEAEGMAKGGREMRFRNPEWTEEDEDLFVGDMSRIFRQGECRRYPPSLILWGPDALDERWPKMQPEDWCGEWQLRRELPWNV